MAYDTMLANRIRTHLGSRAGIREKKMFGGVAFLLNGNMCVGVLNDDLIVRLERDQHEQNLKEAHVRAFDITGRVMKGWAMIDAEGTNRDESLRQWIERAHKIVSKLPPK